MRSSRRHVVVLLAAAATALMSALPKTALADDPAPYHEEKLGSDTVVTFKGDPLDGSGIGTIGLNVRIGPKALRLNLMRPRYNFLTEMYKSVEHM